MAWTWMQVEVLAAEGLILPLVGPGRLTREEAHAEVQRLLGSRKYLGETAALWERGAKDDTVFSGPFTWTIFKHTGDDPRPAARAWLDGFAETLRAIGIDVQIATPITA